jgi:hypothetical protein
MRRIFFLYALGIGAALYACSSGNGHSDFGTGDDGGGTGHDGSGGGDDGGNNGDVGSLGDGTTNNDAPGMTVDTIYANTDTELYSFDPMTNTVKDIGPFQGLGGGTGDNAVTDLAINGNNEIWVNTETAIYTAALPMGGTGSVAVTKKHTISGMPGQKFFALAFAPMGVLGSGEGLVAGDNAGNLYSIDANGAATLLGGFGNDSRGNPWQLSGDIVFFTQNGSAVGLATIRSCPNNKCSLTNDYLALIDVAALTTAFNSHSTGTMLKQIYGTGTTYGELFGVGAWQDKVYAFSRKHTTDAGAFPAELIAIDGTGKGVSLQMFPNITAGWSGAGVTTKASVTIPPPR